MTCWRSLVKPSLILHRHVYLFWSLSCFLCLPWSGDPTEDSAWVGGERRHVGEVPYDPLKSYIDPFICFGLSHAPCVFPCQVTLQKTQRELEERDDMLKKSHTTLSNLTWTCLFVLVSLMLLVSSGDSTDDSAWVGGERRHVGEVPYDPL